MTPGSLIDLTLGILYASVLSLVYLFIVLRINNPPASWKILFIGFVAHTFSSVGFVVFMSTYYGYLGDALFYFITSDKIFKNIISKPYLINDLLFANLERIPSLTQVQLFGTSDPEVISMARYTLPFYLSGLGMFTPTSTLISILPFSGKYLILRTIKNTFPNIEQSVINKVALLTFLLPTALFWGTPILKESFLTFAIGLLTFSLSLIFKRSLILLIVALVLAFTGIKIVFALKSWLIYIFFLSLTIAVAIYIINLPKVKQEPVLRFGILVLFTAIGITLTFFGVQEVIQTTINSLLRVAYGFQTWHLYLGERYGQSTYSLITIPDIMHAQWWQFIIAFPEALFTALFRPFVFEIDRLSEALVLPENLFLLYLSIKAMLRFNTVWKVIKDNPILLTGFIFGILTLYIVGLVSFNFGAMVRYRIPGLITLISTFFFAYFLVKEQQESRTIIQ